MRNNQVEGIIYRIEKEEPMFLLLKRIPKKGGFWQPPCGGVEKDETLLDALYREIKEETGIDKSSIIEIKKDIHHFTIDKDYLTQEPIEKITEHVFGVKVLPETKVDISKNICKEHEDYTWVSFDEAMTMLRWKDNKEAFTSLIRSIRKQA